MLHLGRYDIRSFVEGNLTVSDTALAAVLGLAAHEVPGVVGMSPAGLRESISRILGRSESNEGVVVKSDTQAPGRYQADLYIVVAFGARIPVVVESVSERVHWAARNLAGIELSVVRIHVVGVSRG